MSRVWLWSNLCDGIRAFKEMDLSYRCRLQNDIGPEIVKSIYTSTPSHHRIGEMDRVLGYGSLSGDLVGLRV